MPALMQVFDEPQRTERLALEPAFDAIVDAKERRTTAHLKRHMPRTGAHRVRAHGDDRAADSDRTVLRVVDGALRRSSRASGIRLGGNGSRRDQKTSEDESADGLEGAI